MNQKIYITEAAHILGLTVSAMRALDASGELPARRDGARGKRYYYQWQLDAYRAGPAQSYGIFHKITRNDSQLTEIENEALREFLLSEHLGNFPLTVIAKIQTTPVNQAPQTYLFSYGPRRYKPEQKRDISTLILTAKCLHPNLQLHIEHIEPCRGKYFDKEQRPLWLNGMRTLLENWNGSTRNCGWFDQARSIFQICESNEMKAFESFLNGCVPKQSSDSSESGEDFLILFHAPREHFGYNCHNGTVCDFYIALPLTAQE